MNTDNLAVIFQDGLGIFVRLSAPILLLCMLVGVVVAIMQAVTQIHEQSIGFLMKLIVVVLILVLGGNWMLRTLQEYTVELFGMMV